jgi:hypothetical protein
MARWSQPWPVRTEVMSETHRHWGRRPEDPLEPIGGGRQLRPRGGGPAKLALGAGDDPLLAHEPGDAVPTAGDALVDQLLVDARRAVGLAPARIGRADMDQQGRVAFVAAGCGAMAPGVVPTPRDPQHAAQGPEPKFRAVSRDEVELHCWSSAK